MARAPPPVADAVENRLAIQIAAAAQARWPALRIDPQTVAEALRRHYAQGPPPPGLAAEDFALAAAVAAGDRAAWAVFYAECRAFAQHVARRFCRNDVDAEEIAEDFVAEEAPRRLAGYAGRCSLKGWLAAVTPNVARDWHRRRAREVMPDSQTPQADEPASPPGMDSLAGVTREQALENMEVRIDRRYCETVLRECFKAGWQKLGPQERMVLEYKYRHGLKNREITLVLKAREDVVSKRLKKAVARLGSHLRRHALTRYDCNLETLGRCVDLLVGRASIGSLFGATARSSISPAE